jgi:hypothetical protein
LSGLLLSSAGAWAQTNPEAACRSYLAEFERNGYSAIPKFVHPEEVDRFRNIVMPLVTADNDRALELLRQVFGYDATSESVQHINSLAFMQGYADAISSKLKAAQVRHEPSVILGTVREGKLAHVVVRLRTSAADFKESHLQVLSFKPYGQTWMLMLPAEMEGLANAIQTQVGGVRR